MARRLFFVPEIRRGLAELTGAEAEHLVRVLRAEAGQVHEISDNRQKYLAEIETVRKSLVVFRVMEELPPPPERARVHLFPALFKFDRFEWMVEKATELGVDAIGCFEAVRSDRGLAQASRKRVTRWQRIAVEASEQSRRAIVPDVAEPEALGRLLANACDVKLLLDEDPGTPGLWSVVSQHWPERSTAQRIGVLLGPEGGWTEGERTNIVEAGWQRCSLGSMVLRAETAAIAALSAVNVLWGR
jgi:16S rRNA (uracil1498-N3)-methyltransferase